MNVQRVRSEVQAAREHFPNLDVFSTTDGGLYVKAALQTAIGQMYVIMVTFIGYPTTMPKVTVIAPVVKHSMHMYTAGNICFMHPNLWNPARHDLLYVLAQAAVWLNKHEVYIAKGVWPGPSLKHTA